MSDLGTAYGGWAALAEDASTAYTNPAGLVRIPDTQLVFPLVGLIGGATFEGTSKTPPFPFPPFSPPERGWAHDRLEALMPSFFASVPVSNRLTLGFTATSPFGLGSEFGKDSVVRYISTEGKIAVIDVGPSVGLKVTNNFSVGAGFDIHYIMFTLNHMFGPPLSFPFDSESKNHETGWGYGWHAGILYNLLPCLRLGASFNSKAWLHATGESTLYGPIPPDSFNSRHLRTSAPLPARAQFSIYYDLNPRWALMGTVFYTHWGVLDLIRLKNTAFFGDSYLNVDIPLGYHHTYDYSAGVRFRATRKLWLKAGVQLLDSPSNDLYRSPADPIGSAVIVATGLHYQQNACVGFDLGYGHAFFKDSNINLESPLSTVVGKIKAQSNALGLQVTYNIR